MPKPKIILYADCEKRRIQDESGKQVSLDTARDLWNNCQLADFNLCLQRLAQCDWDWNELDKYYASCDAG